MKAYRCEDGTIRLFRPDMNMHRMNRVSPGVFSPERWSAQIKTLTRRFSTCVNQTAARIALPTFDGEQLTELIKKLVLLDSRWIPGEPGYSLYIRESSRAGRFFLFIHRRSRQGVDSSTIRRTDLDRYAERFGRPS